MAVIELPIFLLAAGALAGAALGGAAGYTLGGLTGAGLGVGVGALAGFGVAGAAYAFSRPPYYGYYGFPAMSPYVAFSGRDFWGLPVYLYNPRLYYSPAFWP